MATKSYSVSQYTTASNNAVYGLEVAITQTTNDSNNTSTINWALNFWCTSATSWGFNMGNHVVVYIDGNAVYNQDPGRVALTGANAKTTICSGSTTVTHNNDGSKSLEVSATYSQRQDSNPNLHNISTSTGSSPLSLLATNRPTYTISYNANGHGTAPSSQTKRTGVNLTLNNFIGNQTSVGATETFTITVDANGGEWTGENGTATRTPQYTYSQTYWNTNEAGTGTNYGSGGTYTADAGATLYAIWQTTTNYTYTYTLPQGTPSKPNGTQSAMYQLWLTENQRQPVESLTPVSYTFTGWFTAAEGGTERTSESQINADETIYAQYSSTPIGSAYVILPEAPVKKGYDFIGWYNFATDEKIGSVGTKYVIQEGVKVIAKYELRAIYEAENNIGYLTLPEREKTYYFNPNFSKMFYDQNILELELNNSTFSPISFEKVTDMSQAFYNCSKITGSPICGNNVVNMSQAYYNCGLLTGIPACGPSVTNLYQTYYNCPNLSGNMYIKNEINDMRGMLYGHNPNYQIDIWLQPDNTNTLNNIRQYGIIDDIPTWTEYSNNSTLADETYNIYVHYNWDGNIS